MALGVPRLFNSTPIENNLQNPVAVPAANLTRLGATAAIGIQPTRSMNSTTADGGFLSNVYGVFNSVLREQGLRREREFILKQQAQQNQQSINLETAQTGKILQLATIIIGGSILLAVFRGKR